MVGGAQIGVAVARCALSPSPSQIEARVEGMRRIAKPTRHDRTVSDLSSTLFPARRVITMEPAAPFADAVAVCDGRITAVGSVDELRRESVVVDDTFDDAVICPGLIDQHLHPILGATTLMTEVIATEDWALPDRVGQRPTSTSQGCAARSVRSLARTTGSSPGAITRCGTAASTARRWTRSATCVRSRSGTGRATNGSSTRRLSAPSGSHATRCRATELPATWSTSTPATGGKPG